MQLKHTLNKNSLEYFQVVISPSIIHKKTMIQINKGVTFSKYLIYQSKLNVKGTHVRAPLFQKFRYGKL